jgi:prepilin-type processing-associated H-X9-DG protein
MDFGSSPGNIDAAGIMDTELSPVANYLKSAKVFKCPADIYDAQNGPRVRSISSNGVLGNKPDQLGTVPNGRNYYGKSTTLPFPGVATKMSHLVKPGPSRVWVILDEQADSLSGTGGDSLFMLNPGAASTQEIWRDLPASYHNGAGSFSFADGHSEIHKWKSPGNPGQTIYPVRKDGSNPWDTVTMRNSGDFEWMQDGMPYQ